MKLSTEAAPHFRTTNTTRKIMIDVLISLIPAVIVSTWIFGFRALFIMLFSMVFAEMLDFSIVRFIRKQKDHIPDFSASVTGLLLGMNLSLAVNWWQIMLGVIVAIILAKQVFGGLGQNFFNPALVGRAFMVISFPTAMTTWYVPFYYQNPDIITSASPLGIISQEGMNTVLQNYTYWDMFIGTIPGSIGEVSALALIIGFIYLVVKGRIKLMIPVSYIGTVLIFSSIFYMVDPTKFGTPLFHLLAGGLILGALFMATDMVTSPMSVNGQLVFGMGAGVLTMIIRFFGSYPEGVSFSILIMNAFVPLIDDWLKPKIYGTSKSEKKHAKIGLILAVVIIAVGLLVPIVYNSTNSTTVQYEFNNTLSAIEEVLKEADSGEYLVSNIPNSKRQLEKYIWKADQNGVLYVSQKNAKIYSPVYKFSENKNEIYVMTVSGVGYRGDVVSVISFIKKDDGQIVLNKIEVIDYSQETPGLGDKIAEESVKERFSLIPESGLNAGVKVDKDAGVTFSANSIDAYKEQGVIKTSDVMTGATITPRAVADSINAAVEFLKEEGVM
nr:RnfABCDGE type electron transport complex subunit D [Petrotoga sp. SL27]